jgi:hypothetical protein
LDYWRPIWIGFVLFFAFCSCFLFVFFLFVFFFPSSFSFHLSHVSLRKVIMNWNVFFFVLFLVFCGAFIGMEFGFLQLSAACDGSFNSSSHNGTSNCTAGNPNNSFSCAVGWVGVVTSVISFGSFALPMKSPPVLQSSDVGPMGFQIYMSSVIVVTSFMVRKRIELFSLFFLLSC